MYSKIAGTGRYLPEKILTNFDLEKMVDTTDEWIRTRSGVERRHIAAPEEVTSDLSVNAARQAMEAADIEPGDIDLIVVGTTTPDQVFPNVAVLVQEKLGIRGCAAFSLEAACTVFIYALSVTDKFVITGQSKCALVIGAECLGRKERARVHVTVHVTHATAAVGDMAGIALLPLEHGQVGFGVRGRCGKQNENSRDGCNVIAVHQSASGIAPLATHCRISAWSASGSGGPPNGICAPTDCVPSTFFTR